MTNDENETNIYYPITFIESVNTIQQMKTINRKMSLLMLLGLGSSGVAAQQQKTDNDQLSRPGRLHCQHPRRGGIRPRTWMRPDACCGPEKPYHTSQKSCCENKAEESYHLINIIEKPNHKCCNGVVYDSTKLNCCSDQVVPYDSPLCEKCRVTDWTEWSDCNEWSTATRVREVVPNEGYTELDCPIGLTFNETVSESGMGDLGVEMREEYGYWTDERSMDSDGLSCSGEMGARFLNKIVGVRDPEDPTGPDAEYRDLLILVDESTSIGAENFEIVKRTLALMVANLCGGIGTDKNRVALMRFSSAVKADLTFSEGVNLNKVLNKIEGLTYKTIINKNQHGSTYTANAMDHALNTVFKHEYGWRDGVHPLGDHVRTEVIIITDGESNDPANTFTVEEQKVRYDQAGIKVYAMGVGDIKKDELEMLTSREKESIFYLLSWKHLAGFNYMVESLMSHDAFNDEGRCIPFSLDPSAKKKAIALHDNDFSNKVGLTVGDIVDMAKERAQNERSLAISRRREENKRQKIEAKLERQQQKQMEKTQEKNQAFVQTFDYDEEIDNSGLDGFLPGGFSFGQASRALPIDRSSGIRVQAQLDDDVE